MAYKQYKLLAISNFATNEVNLNVSNYIILPPNILDKIKNRKAPYYFSLLAENGLKIWVGVKQFTADNGHVVLPHWIYDFLGISGNQLVTVQLEKEIPKGSKVILQPQEKEFFDIPECEGCLETILSNFCLLNRNQTIQIDVLDKKYNILVKDVEPDWKKINFKKPPKTLDEGVIDIKDIDLNVDIDNKFYQEMFENKKRKIEEDKSTYKEENNSTILEENKGLKLTEENVEKLSKEQLRYARLNFFDKKFNIKPKKTDKKKKKELEL